MVERGVMPNIWTEVAPQLNAELEILCLLNFGGEIFGGTGDARGALYKWNGANAWVEVAGTLLGQGRIQSLVEFNNKIYGGTAPNGMLFEWNGVNAWVQDCDQLNLQTHINGLSVIGTKIYGGTSSGGRLFYADTLGGGYKRLVNYSRAKTLVGR